MDAYDEYIDSDNGNDNDEPIDSSDEDEVKFVSSKRKYQYTTFGDEENDYIPGGKDEATYGVFMHGDGSDDDARSHHHRRHRSGRSGDRRSGGEGPPSFRQSKKSDNAPVFVKGKTPIPPTSKNEEEKGENTEADQDEAAKLTEAEKKSPEITQEDRDLKEALRKQQQEANNKFFTLLNRGKGEKRPRRAPMSSSSETLGTGLGFNREGKGLHSSQNSEPQDNVPLGFQSASSSGLGFHKSTETDNIGATHQGLGASGIGTGPIGFGGLGSSLRSFGETPPPRKKLNANIGKWEKYTKGFGAKMLTKMGYKGEGGLGARKRKKIDGNELETKGGISQTIEVVVRPNNLGLGFGSFKEATQLKVNRKIEAEIRGETLPDKPKQKQQTTQPNHASSALPTTSDIMKQQSWKRGNSRKQPRRNVVPYTEILEQQKQAKVIDMRGPNADTGTSEIQLGEELLHNVSILMNTYENKLHSSSHFQKTAERKLKSLQSDLTDIDRRLEEGKQRISKMQIIQRAIDNIDDYMQSTENKADVTEKVHHLVAELRESLSSEDREALQFDQVLVPSLLSPLVQSRVDQWRPLQDESAVTINVVQSLLNLDNEDENIDAAAMERKLSIFCRNILPRVSSEFESIRWNPITDCDVGLRLYEDLLAVVGSTAKVAETSPVEDGNVFILEPDQPTHSDLAEVLREELFRDTIFPKLMRELGNWKPEIKGGQLNQPPDLWLLPWMPHMDHPSILVELVGDLRRKLRAALSLMNRSIANDTVFLESAVSCLEPWRSTLKRDVVQDLTSRYIVQRMSQVLSRLQIRADVVTQIWGVVDLCFRMQRTALMSNIDFFSVIEGSILSNLSVSIYGLLSTNKAMGAQSIAEMYLSWKKKILQIPILRGDEMVCRIFFGIVRMIHDFFQGNVVSEPRPIEFSNVLIRRRKEERDEANEVLDKIQSRDSLEFRKRSISRRNDGAASFRDVVEEFAQEHEISFRPRTTGKDRTEDGKPIFLFGKVPLYFDANVVFCLQKTEWRPTSLEQLLFLARNG